MDTKERIKDFITSTAKEDPEAAKAALHDVLTAKFANKVNPQEETPAVEPDATDDATPETDTAAE